MKTNNIGKAIICLCFLSSFYSCKKTDTELNNETAIGISKAKQQIAKQIEEFGGIPEVITINQKLPATLVDMDGNPVDKTIFLNNNLVSACAGDIPDYVDLKQYVRIYQCAAAGLGGPGFKIQFEFNVSWNNNVVLQSPYNSNNKTKGKVRITHPTFGTVFDKTTYDAKITDLGVDPVNTSNNIYRIKFTCNDIILATYINDLNYTLRLGGTFVSDCSSLDQYGLALSDPAGWGFSPGTAYSPCSRNEKGWFSATALYRRLSISGYNPLSNSCDYSGVFIRPDLQAVQYSFNNGSTWSDFQNYTATTPSGLGILNSKYVRYSDFAQSPLLTPGTYNIVIRYKNWKYNSTPPSNWPIPTTATACRTYGNDLDNSYGYEFYPNTVIP